MKHVTRHNGPVAVTPMQLRKASRGYVYHGTPTAPMPSTVKAKLVDAWTSDSGRYYYDLAHGLGRPVFVKAFDSFTGYVIPLSDEQIVAGDLDTTRIWIDNDAGADRITLYYF